MTKYVLSPFYPVSSKWETSHRAGWALYWAHSLGATLLTGQELPALSSFSPDEDELYIYHGMEWNDALNLQGGLTRAVLERVEWWVRLIALFLPRNKVVSLDRPMPVYCDLFLNRVLHEEKRGLPEQALLIDQFHKICRKWRRVERDRTYTVQLFPAPALGQGRLVIGDSHALSQYGGGDVIIRNDGQTLYGALKNGFFNKETMRGSHIPVHALDHNTVVRLPVVTYFGNIDLRHHLARLSDPVASTMELAREYVRQLTQFKKDWQVPEIAAVEALAINEDGRRIPKTGWYKGAPFYGSWEQRSGLKDIFNATLQTAGKKAGVKIIAHPEHFVNDEGELSLEVMEKPQSVHIRPSEYTLIQRGLAWSGV